MGRRPVETIDDELVESEAAEWDVSTEEESTPQISVDDTLPSDVSPWIEE
jgi:hypothetical protein